MAGIIAKQVEAQNPQVKTQQTINQMMSSILDKENMRNRFDELLGKRSPQFISSIVSMVNADSNLQEAFRYAPMTVIQSALKAATFDLPIDQNLGYAYIVPFRNKKEDGSKRMEATFILGWKGMHQLALRTGVYKTINVIDIRQGELKSYNRLTEEISIEFEEDEEKREALPIVGYVGYYKMINGTEKTVYMTKKQIELHERKFRKGQYMGKGWRDDWDAMARKTVYRKLIGKWGVMSIDYRSASEAQDLMQQMEAEDTQLDAQVAAQEVRDAVDVDYTVDESTGEVVDAKEASDVREKVEPERN